MTQQQKPNFQRLLLKAAGFLHSSLSDLFTARENAMTDAATVSRNMAAEQHKLNYWTYSTRHKKRRVAFLLLGLFKHS
jgi:hypothetical protein